MERYPNLADWKIKDVSNNSLEQELYKMNTIFQQRKQKNLTIEIRNEVEEK